MPHYRTRSHSRITPVERPAKNASRIPITQCEPGVVWSRTSFVNASSSMSKKQNFQSRREFLKLCGMAGLGVAAPFVFPGASGAETRDASPYEGPYYVVFNASGGWDTTYLMDPKGVGDINRLYQEG